MNGTSLNSRARFLWMLFLFYGIALIGQIHAQDNLWEQIYKASSEDKPKTLIELCLKAREQEIAVKNWGRATEALMIETQAKMEIDAGGEKVLVWLDAELAKLPAEVKPVLWAQRGIFISSTLSRGFGGFRRRGHFIERQHEVQAETELSDPENLDITTWSEQRKWHEMMRSYAEALKEPASLQAMPIEKYQGVLKLGNFGATTTPTLYHFLVLETLDKMGSYLEDDPEIVLNQDSPAFANLDRFLSWKLPQGQWPKNFKYTDQWQQREGFQLWQDYLTMCKSKGQMDALIYGNLKRLKWARLTLREQDSHTEVLDRSYREFALAYPKSTMTPLIYLDHAEIHRNKIPKKSHEILTAGATAHPDSPFRPNLLNAIMAIEEKNIHVSASLNWVPNEQAMKINTSNLEKLWFRLVPLPNPVKPRDFLEDKNRLTEKYKKQLLAQKPHLEWSENVKDQKDFLPVASSFKAPKSITPGQYLLYVSSKETFSENDNDLFAAFVSATTLHLQANDLRGSTQGAVVDAITGEPLAGVEVFAHYRHKIIPGFAEKKTVTDAQGLFHFNDLQNQFLFVAKRDGNGSSYLESYARDQDSESNAIEGVIFTDRQAYRPGQEVQFKGIFHVAAAKNAEPQLPKEGTKIELVLESANGEVIKTQDFVTNGFGSINGSFMLPEQGLLGDYNISARGRISASTSFKVEEYKRPEMQAKITPTGEPARLGTPVQLELLATAISGEAMSQAQVKWTVTRSSYYWNQNEAPEVIQGQGITDKEGKCQISFPTKIPNLQGSDKESNPSSDYAVKATVVSPNGTSAEVNWSVALSKASFSANIDSTQAHYLSPSKIPVKVQFIAHDSRPVAGKGTLEAFPVLQSEKWLLDDERTEEDRKLKYGNRHSSQEVVVNAEGIGKAELSLPAGEWQLRLTSKDSAGNEVTAEEFITVFDPKNNRSPFTRHEFLFYEIPSESVLQPGMSARFIWASGAPQTRALFRIIQNNRILKEFWSQAGSTQQLIEIPVTEEMRGGFSIQVSQVVRNHFSSDWERVSVPWENKKLALSWTRFRSKLKPGEQDTWSAKVNPPAGSSLNETEFLATLYDRSLDELFGPHHFQSLLGWFRSDSTYFNTSTSCQEHTPISTLSHHNQAQRLNENNNNYAQWVHELRLLDMRLKGMRQKDGLMRASRTLAETALPLASDSAAPSAYGDESEGAASGKDADPFDIDKPEGNAPQQAIISPRKNFSETAFFFPTLRADADGQIEMSFTMPESITGWRFLGLAHDAHYRSGLLTGEMETSLPFMVRPNLPRFVRVGDEIELTSRLVNLGPSNAKVLAKLDLSSGKEAGDLNAKLCQGSPQQELEIPAGETKVVTWKLRIPEMSEWIQVKTTATANFAAAKDFPAQSVGDGEEAWLPVLPSRIPVRDAMTKTLRQEGTHELTLEALQQAKSSDQGGPLHLGYQVEVVPRPAWNVVKALPYLMEYPHECSEQRFNRFYANALAHHLVKKNPAIKEVFDAWKREAAQAKGKSDAFTSPLALNPEQKAVLLEETPYLMDAVSERDERLRIATLFDHNRLTAELERTLGEIGLAQLPNGAFPWFPGQWATENEYITTYIVAGFARLRELGIEPVDMSIALKSLPYLDGEMHEKYLDLKKNHALDRNNLTPSVAFYLYARSFYLKDLSITNKHKASFDYWKSQAVNFWASLNNLQSRAHLCCALHRLDQPATCQLILASMREHALQHDDLGMHWRQLDRGAAWWQNPIETQAALIECFHTVAKDPIAVRECQIWLLQQKRTQHWESTKSTSVAVHATLIDGQFDLLQRNGKTTLKIGDRPVVPDKQAEAGTGRIRASLAANEIQTSDAKVTVTTEGKSPAWVNVFWQSLQEMDHVSASKSTTSPDRDDTLSVKKEYFVKVAHATGNKLQALDAKQPMQLKVGDELVVRLTLKCDRSYEFVHLKDLRASGAEPMDAISGYRMFPLGYAYQETRDTATHFFFDSLNAGSHVFEYSVRFQHAGHFPSGVAEVECLYAPEFRARSQSLRVKVLPQN